MGKIVKLRHNSEVLYDLAEERLDEGDFSSAINFLYSVYLRRPTPEICCDIAETYMDAGLWDSAEFYLFKALALGGDRNEISALLVELFMSKNDLETAFYYTGGENVPEELQKDILDEHAADNASPIYVWSDEKAAKTIDLARQLIANHEYGDFVISLLQSITPDKKEYVDANNMLALLCLDSGKPAESIEYSEKAIGVKENLLSYCNLMLAYHLVGDEREAEAAAKIETFKADVFAESHIALSYLNADNYLAAEKHAKKVLDTCPYDKLFLLRYALLLHKRGLSKEAHAYAIRAARIYPDWLAPRYFAQAIYENKELDVKELRLDEATTREWCMYLLRKLQGVKTKRGMTRLFSDPEFVNKLDFLFQTGINSLQVRIGSAISFCDKGLDYIKDVLLRPDTDVTVKKRLIIELIYHDRLSTLKFTVNDLYTELEFISGSEFPDELKTAYCLAFGTLAMITNDFEKKVYDVTKKFMSKFDVLSEDDKNVSALAAAIVCKTNVCDFKREYVAEIFGCKFEDVKRILSVLTAKKGEK